MNTGQLGTSSGLLNDSYKVNNYIDDNLLVSTITLNKTAKGGFQMSSNISSNFVGARLNERLSAVHGFNFKVK